MLSSGALCAVKQTYNNAHQLYKRALTSLGRPRSELNTGPGWLILRKKSDSNSSKKRTKSKAEYGTIPPLYAKEDPKNVKLSQTLLIVMHGRCSSLK